MVFNPYPYQETKGNEMLAILRTLDVIVLSPPARMISSSPCLK